MSYETFEELELGAQQSTMLLPPFQYREDMGEHQWLINHFQLSMEASHRRFRIYRYHNELYRGVHDMGFRTSRRNNTLEERFPRHVVNFVYDSIDARAALRAKRKSNLAFLPNDQNDIKDINNAKACEKLYNNRAEEMGLDDIHTDADQWIDIFGDAFLFVLWDDAAKDVKVKLMPPNRVFPELRRDTYDLKELDHIEYVEWVHRRKVQAMYPDRMVVDPYNYNYNPHPDLGSYSEYTDMDLYRGENHDQEVLVHHFFHRKTKALPKGRHIVYTDTDVLYAGDLPYRHGKLPVVRDGDIRLPESFWRLSFITQIEQMQRSYNDRYSSVSRDLSMNGPKWTMPKGAKVKHASLSADHNIIEYTGMVAPQLMTYNSTNYQNYDFLEKVKEQIYEFGKVYDISRGQVPTGVTANSALRFLDEQETRRSDVLFQNKERRITDVGNLLVSVMAEYYKEGDNRVARGLGDFNEYMVDDFEGNYPNFGKIYKVKPENTSSLPATKSGRISAIVDINASTQTDPIFTREEVIQLLDLGLDEGFKSAATVAVTGAKKMISDILEDREPALITESDDHMVYYDIFETFMQSPMYKQKVDEQKTEMFEKAVMVIEQALYQKSLVNPKMLQLLLDKEYFPRYAKPQIPLATLAAQQGMAGTPVEGGVDSSQIKNIPEQTKDIKTENQGGSK